jgi:cytochrome c553
VSTAATAHSPRAYSNLAQLMRGIPFTFANIVFDAQSEDPGAPREPAAVGGGATATFKNVYGGWQEVENSALALSESANLILIPGRLCENGRPVPVDQPDFRAAAEALAEAGRAAYKAAQAKSMDEIISVSETVAAACSQCHEPYRDFDDPNDRCQVTRAKAE